MSDQPAAARKLIAPARGQVAFESFAPVEPGVGEIFVRGVHSTVSIGTELTMISGDVPEDSNWARMTRYPFPLGYSLCGRIERIGSGVDKFAVGDMVVGYWPHADYVTVRADSVLGKVPEDLDTKLASTFALGLIAMNGVRRARLELGESVVVYGLGVLGMLAVQLARMSGCRPVIGVDLAETRREIALRLGADAVLDGTDAPARVREFTGGRGADVLFEVTGNPKVIPDEFRVLKRFGRAVLLSSPRGPSSFDFHDLCNGPSITIIGAHNGSTPQCETVFSQWTWPRNCEFYLRLVRDGELKVADMITHVHPADEAPEVYGRLLENRGAVGVVVLDWTV